MATLDLDMEALWWGLPDEQRRYAWRLMISKRPFEAMRILIQATGSAPKARALVAWAAAEMISNAGRQ